MKTPSIHYIQRCRACGGENLHRFLNLPRMPLTDDFIVASRFGEEFRADIDVFVCRECLVVQTQHNVDVSDYYEDYQYSVGGSVTASSFMELLAKNLQTAYYPGIRGRKVLEIGSGDGEQLAAFHRTGCHVLGFEPSSVLCQVAESKGISTIQGLFQAGSIELLPEGFREVDIVMLSYTFDHLPDPRAFLAAVRSILERNSGLLVVEIHDLEKIIERQEYCLFEHEHSIYLTEATVREMCRMEGFVVIDFDLVPEKDRRANSLIFVATPEGSNLAHRAVVPKTPVRFSDLEFYGQISQEIHQGIANLERFVDETVSPGKKLAGYGAGGRGVMTLAALGNAAKFRYLVDKKPKRPGLVVPASGLPLVNLAALSDDPVDEILVFSFGYMREIQAELGLRGYRQAQFHSLLDILAGRF